MHSSRVISDVLDQHVEDLAILWAIRSRSTTAPHVALRHLRRFDDRIMAHLDGCAVGGAAATKRLLAALERASASRVFALGVVALGAPGPEFDLMLDFAAVAPDVVPGLVSALGWIRRDRLAGIGKALLQSRNHISAKDRAGGMPASPSRSGPRSTPGNEGSDALLRAEAVRTAATLDRSVGEFDADRIGLLHPDLEFWMLWSSVLLGARGAALERLSRVGYRPGAHRTRAFTLSKSVRNPNTRDESAAKIA